MLIIAVIIVVLTDLQIEIADFVAELGADIDGISGIQIDRIPVGVTACDLSISIRPFGDLCRRFWIPIGLCRFCFTGRYPI